MNKVPFAILNLEVEKLYAKEFPKDATKAIEAHCEFITDFIEACGWTTDEYLYEWSTLGKMN